jgi:Flp pilus assembly pilin Flp
MRSRFIQFHARSQNSERGASAITYTLIVTLEIVICIVAVSFYGAKVSALLLSVAASL